MAPEWHRASVRPIGLKRKGPHVPSQILRHQATRPPSTVTFLDHVPYQAQSVNKRAYNPQSMIQSSTLQWLRDKASTSGQLWAIFTGKKQGLAWQSRSPASRSLIQSAGGSLLYHLLPQTLIFKSYLSPLVILSSKKLFTHCPLNWLTLIYPLKIWETEVRLLKPSISPGQTYPQGLD